MLKSDTYSRYYGIKLKLEPVFNMPSKFFILTLAVFSPKYKYLINDLICRHYPRFGSGVNGFLKLF